MTFCGLDQELLLEPGKKQPCAEARGIAAYLVQEEEDLSLTDLGNILNSDGGMFSPPPANPRSNISGGALGLFQVSGLNRASILIVP